VPILSVNRLGVRFGGVVALDGVSFEVEARQIVGLIGPNGAGKTTLFNCLSRLYTPQAGDILFDGVPLLSLPAHRIARLGIGRTFQNLALFPRLTVAQNVMVGTHPRTRAGFVSSAVRLAWVEREDENCRRAAMELRSPTGPRPTCPLRRSSGWSWRARSRASRSCCCSMSLPADSITRTCTNSPR
jgi:branched-chain amino acid transport system ATP-binding protein